MATPDTMVQSGATELTKRVPAAGGPKPRRI